MVVETTREAEALFEHVALCSGSMLYCVCLLYFGCLYAPTIGGLVLLLRANPFVLLLAGILGWGLWCIAQTISFCQVRCLASVHLTALAPSSSVIISLGSCAAAVFIVRCILHCVLVHLDFCYLC
jgi:hypothetical protein